jgi:3-keto-disaccharide hydrolase
MRKFIAPLVLGALAVAVALPAGAHTRHTHHGKARCGQTHHGWEVIFDGSKRCLERWRYAGGATMTLQRDGTVRSGPGGEPGLGVLWYAERPYGDFVLRLQFRDDAPADRANSGVQVRFPAPHPPVPGCPTTFNGSEQNNAAWIAVNCGHEVQINDSPDGEPFDPRKTGSIYGFADLDSAHSHPTGKGAWNDLEIKVVGQHYTVTRNGVVINEFENVPGLPFPGRPNDPGSESRGLVGYIGLQSHGGTNDVVSFRDIRIKDLSDRD